MKRILSGLLVVVAAIVIAGASHAASPPIGLKHTVTGYSQEAKKVTADFSLQVENRGDTPIQELTLSLVPLPPVVAEKTTLNLGYFAPHEKRDVFVQIVTRMTRLDRERLSRTLLFWAGTYVNTAGETAEFAATSRPGGAK